MQAFENIKKYFDNVFLNVIKNYHKTQNDFINSPTPSSSLEIPTRIQFYINTK